MYLEHCDWTNEVTDSIVNHLLKGRTVAVTINSLHEFDINMTLVRGTVLILVNIQSANNISFVKSPDWKSVPSNMNIS